MTLEHRRYPRPFGRSSVPRADVKSMTTRNSNSLRLCLHTVAVEIVVFVLAASGRVSYGFDPVSYKAPNGSIELSVLGTYRGGWYSKRTPTYPAYDKWTQRVFYGSDDRNRVEVIDISNPTSPALVSTISTGPPTRIVVSSEGILAVSGSNQVKFYNANGVQLTAAVSASGAGDLEFTPDGTKLVVNQSGALGVINLSGANFANCRAGSAGCNLNPTVSTASFGAFNSQRAALLAAGVRLPYPTLTVAQQLDPASISVTPDGSAAWVSLIDSNALLKLDLQTSQFGIFGLGAKDNSVAGNGFDASDQDGGINIRTWPMKTFYEPDGIGTIIVGGQPYIVTANEGDPRADLSGVDFHQRLSTLSLDPTAFPNAATLKQNQNLGRLRVSRIDGDTDGDGDLDQIYGFGTRSLAVWTANGQLAGETGDQFEQVTAAALPNNFNAAEDSNTIDDRSDDRGPESEEATVGAIDGHHYAFIGLERISGVMVYDVTDPFHPAFQQYINNRNFAVSPNAVCGTRGGVALASCATAGDLETEGVTFVSAADSPIGLPLLLVSHEASDSVTIYKIASLAVPEPTGRSLLLTALCCTALIRRAARHELPTNAALVVCAGRSATGCLTGLGSSMLCGRQTGLIYRRKPGSKNLADTRHVGRVFPA